MQYVTTSVHPMSTNDAWYKYANISTSYNFLLLRVLFHSIHKFKMLAQKYQPRWEDIFISFNLIEMKFLHNKWSNRASHKQHQNKCDQNDVIQLFSIPLLGSKHNTTSQRKTETIDTNESIQMHKEFPSETNHSFFNSIFLSIAVRLETENTSEKQAEMKMFVCVYCALSLYLTSTVCVKFFLFFSFLFCSPEGSCPK